MCATLIIVRLLDCGLYAIEISKYVAGGCYYIICALLHLHIEGVHSFCTGTI